MKKFKGPDLSDLKVPPFLSDLYYDLRDRRLLPLIALILVAIVAVPFLLGGGSKQESSPPPPAVTGTVSSVPGADSSQLTVVQAEPGLRDYRKRLKGRPRNPFVQRYTGPVLKGAKLNPQTTTTTSSTTTTASTTTTSASGATFTSPPSTSPVSSPGSGGSGSGGGSGSTPALTYFSFAIDVKISKHNGSSGAEASSGATTRHRVMPTTSLPGKKAPVVTYMGVVDKGTKVLFLISADVKSIFGDAKCSAGTADVCQLLEVEPGFPETFVYGPNDARYKINVLKIEPVVTGHS